MHHKFNKLNEKKTPLDFSMEITYQEFEQLYPK